MSVGSLISSAYSSLLGKSGSPSTGFSATNEKTGAKIWTQINIKDVEVSSSSINTSHPVSSEQVTDGSTFTSLLAADINTLKIIQPSRMRITTLCASITAINSITAVFSDTKSTVKVTTKGITATNLAVISIDISQTPENLSSMEVVIELERVAPPSPSNSSGGSNTAKAASSLNLPKLSISIPSPLQVASTVVGLYNKVSSFF